MIREETKKILDLHDQGKTVTEINQLTGISKKKIYKRVYEYRGQINKAFPEIDPDVLIEMYSGGMSIKSIGKKTGHSKEYLIKKINDLGIKRGTHDLLIKTEEQVRKELNDLNLGIEYVSGYMNCDSRITVKCNSCGDTFAISAQILRHKPKQFHCKNCSELKREKEQSEAEIRSAIESGSKRIKDYLNRREEAAICRYCGFPFKRIKGFGNVLKIYCSEECFTKMKQRIARRERHHRDRRLKKCPERVWNITVPRLYERDKGICWICGGMTDLNDKIVRDGTIICGDMYPSIDHIVPVAQGGNHTWENIRLAHRKCNSVRWWTENRRP